MTRDDYMLLSEEVDMIENALKTVMYKLLSEKSNGYNQRLLFDRVREASRNASDAQELVRDILYG